MNTKTIEFQRLSVAISWLRFPLILCVVLLHCYCTVPLPHRENHQLYFNIVYPFGLWLGESGVPAFFFISGFLFYISQKSYIERIKSRVHTLLYPYLLWNSIFLAIYLVLFWIGHPLDILGKNISDYGVFDYIRAYIDRGEYNEGNNGPILCTYWYVRNLFLLCLTSPLWYYLNKKLKFLFPLLLVAWWMSLHHNALLAESILFFNIGACFAIYDINPLEQIIRKRILFLTFWLILSFADLLTHSIVNFIGAFYIHRLSLIINIFAFLLLADMITKGEKGKVNPFLMGSVFWVFATHDHLAIALRRLCMHYFGTVSDVTHFILYWMTFIVVVTLCLLSYAIMNRLFPKFVKFATGNRQQK